ncbi:MAG: Spy/CpxP family protein refolding chaperone [Planctomycetota bacterium]
MERSNLKISLIAVLAVVMCAGMASAAPGGNDGERQRDSQREKGDRPERGEKGERGERTGRGGAKAVFEGVELTDEQQEAVREIMESKKAERDEIRAEMRDARESGDQEAMKAIGERMMSLMDETHEAVRAELTADQQAQFDENLAKLKEKAEQRRAERGERKDKGEGKKGKKKADADGEE